MELYNKNMEIIKEYRKDLYDSLFDELKSKTFDEEQIKEIISIKTREEISSIEILLDETNYRLNSIYCPVKEANIWADSLELNGIGKVISVFGFGNGLYIRKLLDKIQEQDVIVIYEPSYTIFNYVIQNYDIRDILKDTRMLIVLEKINKEEFRQSLKSIIYWSNLFSQRQYTLPQYDRMFPNSYKEFSDIIVANNDRAVMMRNTESLFGRIVVDNTFQNLKYMNGCNILKDYIGKFPEDVPAIIVSAGPSLDKNIDELKRVNGRAVIFGIDRSLKYLYQRGIEPDFAVTVDPLKPVEYFGGDYAVRVPLFAELHSNQQILDLHEGKKIFYNAFAYINSALDKFDKIINPVIPIGTSVATAAFALCIAMKFKRIILIGQDLAYSEDGNSTHAGGIDSEQVLYEELWVDGINGEKVRTRYDWLEFLNWFGDIIEEHEEVEVIDATEGGAKLRGSKVMVLRDAIDQYCVEKFDCKSLNDTMSTAFNKDELIQIEEYIETSKSDLARIKNKAKESVEACEKMIINCKKNIDENKASRTLVKKISKANKFINNRPIYSFIDSYITDATVSNMRDIYQISEDEVADKISTFVQGKEVYEQIIKATDEIAEIIEKSPFLKRNIIKF